MSGDFEQTVNQEPVEEFGMDGFWEASEDTAINDVSDPAPVEAPAPASVAEPEPEPVDEGTPESEPAPEVPAPAPEAPVAAPAEPEDDLTLMRTELNNALATISELTAQVEQVKNQGTGPELEIPTDASQISSLDFLRGRDVADILGDSDTFNGLLNEIATVAARAGQQAGYEQALRAMPEVVQKSAQQQFQVQAATESFFNINSDLKPFRQAVSLAAMEFYQKNPQATIEQILEGGGKKAREMLRIRGTTATRKPAQPAVGASGVQRTASQPTLNPVEQQIMDLIDLA